MSEELYFLIFQEYSYMVFRIQVKHQSSNNNYCPIKINFQCLLYFMTMIFSVTNCFIECIWTITKLIMTRPIRLQMVNDFGQIPVHLFQKGNLLYNYRGKKLYFWVKSTSKLNTQYHLESNSRHNEYQCRVQNALNVAISKFITVEKKNPNFNYNFM